MRTSTSLKVGFAAFATFVALGSCEVVARLMFPAPPDGRREPQLVYAYDPELKYVNVPNQRGWLEDGLVTINSLGFRGREVASPKPAGRFRIVAIGDSVTLGMGVGDAETYCARLEQLLRAAHPSRDLEVVNLGVGGYGTRQEVSLLRRHLSTLRPDLVVLGFYANDVADALDDIDVTGRGGTRLAVATPQPGQILHMNPTPSSWVDRQLRKVRVVYLAGRAFNRWRGAGEWAMARYSIEHDVLEGRETPEIERGWKLVERQLDALRSLADAGAFPVAVIMLPSLDQVTGEYARATYQTRVRSLAEEFHFSVIDPLPALMRSPMQKRALFIPYDRNHPSAAGHEIIAQSVSDFLESHGVFK